MVRHTLKILQQMLQDFESVFDHFGTLYFKGLRLGNKKNDHVFQDDHKPIIYILLKDFTYNQKNS